MGANVPVRKPSGVDTSQGMNCSFEHILDPRNSLVDLIDRVALYALRKKKFPRVLVTVKHPVAYRNAVPLFALERSVSFLLHPKAYPSL